MAAKGKGGRKAPLRARRKALAPAKTDAASLKQQLGEARAQQAATAGILRVMSRSPADVQPVFDAIVKSALHLIGGHSAGVFRVVGNVLHLAALTSTSKAGDAVLRRIFPVPLKEIYLGLLGLAIRTRSAQFISDTERVPESQARARELGRARGYRSILVVPLLYQGAAIGLIAVTRREPGPFSNHQIDLLKTFADQAVIAIENVRLFNETKEALDFQRASGDILASISSSITEAKPVFDAIVRNVLRLFGTRYTAVFLLRGDQIELACLKGDPKFEKSFDKAFPQLVNADTLTGKVLLSGKVMQLAPIIGNPESSEQSVELAKRFGYDAMIITPMMREGRVIGAIATAHRDAIGFDEKQVALIKAFADQAVIAIENVRLFNETKEALERQTATAEILKVIASSPSDLRPVFDAILQSATRLCDAHLGILNLYDGEKFRTGAQCGGKPEFVKWLFERDAFVPEPGTAVARMLVERQPVHVPDLRESAGYRERSLVTVKMVELGGGRSFVTVPLLKEGAVIGNIGIYRPEVRPFTDKQIDLVRTFADQAVIAIENVRLFNETKEALERQTATAEILRVISGSPTDLQPVMDAVGENAARLCEAQNADIFKVEGDVVRLVARHGSVTTSLRVGEARAITRGSVSGRAILERTLVHLHDAREEVETEFPDIREAVLREGIRTMLAIPLLREGLPIGAITIFRTDVRPFTTKQIQLLQTFADQAVIAIENVRLFKELEARNKDLAETLQQQTATAEILRVISSTPTNTQPVFDAIVDSAVRLFNGMGVAIVQVEGDHIQLAAGGGPMVSEYPSWRASFPMPLTRDSASGRAILDRAVLDIDDIEAPEAPLFARDSGRLLGYRAIAQAPMLREGVAVGAIGVMRRESSPLSEKQLKLLQTFADQAVIAIENVRLFNETKEALEQQKASAEVLGAISESIADTKPVFDKILESCERLFEGHLVGVTLVTGDGKIDLAAFHGGDFEKLKSVYPLPLSREGGSGTAILDGTVAHYPDIEAPGVPPGVTAGCRTIGMRSIIFAPMLFEGRGIGAIWVGRRLTGQFTDKQTALLRTFANQAVIAIQNARLFNETKGALERQTATAEILKVISSSPTDLKPVYDAILENAMRLCEAHLGLLGLYDGLVYQNVAQRGASKEFAEWSSRPYVPDPRISSIGRLIAERQPVHHPDLRESIGYREGVERAVKIVELEGARSYLAVPMLKEGAVIGGILVYRPEVRPFTQKQIELLSTFASQAVIAIENVRLFKELQERTDALSRSVGQLTALGEVGQAISSTLDLEKVLQTIVSRAVQLTGLDGGSIYEYDERAEEFRLQAADHLEHELLEAVRRAPIRKGDGTVGRTALTLEPAQVPDVLDDSYQSSRKEVLIRAGYRAVLTVPLLRDDHIIGALSVNRKTPGPFAPEIVELLKTFATQSAMAIQNARLFREIAEKGRQLETASRHKSDFLASMSHELRTPLNAILGFNEMILGRIYGEVPADMKEPLEDIQKSGKHLLRLINNVLDLAKIEAGRMELSLTDYSVHDTVESVRATLRPLAAEKGLEFLATLPDDLPLAYGDSGRITQCLMNLAGNSLKFTKSGRVGISVAEKDGLLTFRVTDTGIGIPPDKIASLFTEFKQTDATIASEYGGTGLGLSITKKFIEMHGGRIWIESELGKGSAFIFEVPLRVSQ